MGIAGISFVALLFGIGAPAPAHAAVAAETRFVLDTLSFLIHGFLIFWMAAGFSMLEAGMVRTKSVSTILLKNITLFSIAGIAFYLTGFNLMHTGVEGGFMGTIGPWVRDDAAALAGDYSAGFSSSSNWFFQMLFAATTASIISGALAERIKLLPFFAFIVVLTAFLYPIQGAWGWGGGWLTGIGFKDFAGSTHVHSVAGWAALSGAIILGARRGKFDADGNDRIIPASSLPLATLGTMILWMGWFGFNGGSLGAVASAADIITVSNVYVNTTMASAGGIVTAVILMQIKTRKVDLATVLNGGLAGLVSITAGPDTPTVGQAILIGSVGAVVMIVSTWALLKFKIDDVVGAIPVHLSCGIWGTLAVPLTDPATSFLAQLIGIAAIAAFMLLTSALAWLVIKATMGLRLSQAEEAIGIDKVETGTLAYPEFGTKAYYDKS